MSVRESATIEGQDASPSRVESVRIGSSFPAHLRPYYWMLVGAFSFAVMGAFTHAVASEIDWRIIALVRAMLATTFAASLALRAGKKLVLVGTPTLWMRSISGSISLVCTFFALTRLPIAETLTLTNMFPLWVVLLSWPLLGHLPSRSSWVAAMIAVGGVVVMGLAEMNHSHWSWNPAYLVAIFASCTSAIAMIGLHRLGNMPPAAIVTHFSAVAVLFCIGSLIMPGAAPIHGNHFTWLTSLDLLGVGIAATAGQLSITRAFATGSPSKISVVALTQVIFAFVFDLMFWNHPISSGKLAGMLLILLPTGWVLMHSADQKHPNEQSD